MKIAILGGTFNPPHIGHLIIGERAHSVLKLDRVFFIPANIPPIKGKFTEIGKHHRLKMTQLATKDNPHFTVLDWELKRGGVSYTIDTVNEIRAKLSPTEIYLIMGWDQAQIFDKWKDHNKLVELCKLIVFTRPGYESTLPAILKDNGKMLPLYIDISSSMIRDMLMRGESIRYLVPNAVISYIYKHKLYGVKGHDFFLAR